MRRTLSYAVVAGVVVLAVLSAAPASGERRGDPQRERDRVRARQAEVSSQIDVMKASLGKIDATLQALAAQLREQERLSAQADHAVAQADHKAARAARAVDASARRLARLRREMSVRAIAQYVSPPADATLAVLEVKDSREAEVRRTYIELIAANDAKLAAQLSDAAKELRAERRRARDAFDRVKVKRAEQKKRTASVRAAAAEQRRFDAALTGRINASVTESIQLASTDKALSTRIALEQAALAARLAEQAAAARAEGAARAEAAARARAAGQATARARAADAARARTVAAQQAAAPVRPRATPDTSRRRQVSPPAPPARRVDANPVPASSRGSGGIALSTVGGITVNAQIADRLSALLSAARGAGVTLTGGGYRDPSEQIALRQSHCGSSHYAIYDMPASACHPPTAPPGSSMHEVGLAIDFENCGSHSTACWQWLSGNAGHFGFFNLASEPWHWSINGS